jgi:hypothetical protein
VLLQISQFNFTTTTAISPLDTLAVIYGGFQNLPGGSLGTASGRLPKCLRPSKAVVVSCSNNDGFLGPFSFAAPVPTYTPSFNLIIDPYGQLFVKAAGTYTGVIPPGAHTFNRQTANYFARIAPHIRVKRNFVIQREFTNVTGFTAPSAQSDALRDSHVCDYHHGVAAYCWSSNAQNGNNNVMDAYVRVGRTHKKGVEFYGDPVLLTPDNSTLFIWDTAVAIHRAHNDVVVASAGIIYFEDTSSPRGVPGYFVSTDGGRSFGALQYLDPATFNPTTGFYFSDCRGVLADPFGNFFYNVTGSSDGQPDVLIYASSDLGATWTRIFTTATSALPAGDGIYYDYPQYTLGVNGAGQYGLWWNAAYLLPSGDSPQVIGFIPVNGLGEYGAGVVQQYPQWINAVYNSDITVAGDGAVFLSDFAVAITDYSADTLFVKQPPNAMVTDPMDPSLLVCAGSVGSTVYQNISGPSVHSYPGPPDGYGWYFGVSTKSLQWDERRKCLYHLTAEQIYLGSQDMYLFMRVSFDRGTTWSERVYLASTHKNNRGLQTLALDERDGSMILGWYDSRNSEGSYATQYQGAHLTKEELDCVVQRARESVEG